MLFQWDRPLARAPSPDPPFAAASRTSRLAAEQIKPHAPLIRDRVLEFIAGRGPDGATDEETALGLRIRESTARARRVELRDQGLIADSGQVRPTTSGRAAVVWRAKGSESRVQSGALDSRPSTLD